MSLIPYRELLPLATLKVLTELMQKSKYRRMAPTLSDEFDAKVLYTAIRCQMTDDPRGAAKVAKLYADAGLVGPRVVGGQARQGPAVIPSRANIPYTVVLALGQLLLKGNGVETLVSSERLGRFDVAPKMTINYINMGDPYERTLLFINYRTWRVGGWGDAVERAEHQGVKFA